MIRGRAMHNNLQSRGRCIVHVHARQRGSVLIVAMVVIFVLVSMIIIMAQRVRVEAVASANDESAAEARLVEKGAEQWILGLFDQATDPVESLDESTFEAVPVGTGYFWLVRPDYGDASQPQFGLVDESSKLDINIASQDVLARLEGLDDNLAAAMVDWRDEDDTASDGGAESQVYLQKNDPYQAKNAPFETVEELLMVDGWSRDLLYGPKGDAAQQLADSITASRYQIQGEFDFLTVWGKPSVVSDDGSTRLNPNAQQTRSEFAQMLTDEIGSSRSDEIMASIEASREPYENVLEFAVRTGLTSDELVSIEPRLVVERPSEGGQAAIPRMYVNINTAPKEVLMTLEGMSESDADTLIAQRPVAGTSLTNPGSIAWVLDAFGNAQRVQQKLIDLGNQITGRGEFYSADIVAASGNGRSFRRVRIVVDISSTGPKIVYRRDITDQGWPLDESILQSLRDGGGI